MNKLITAAAKLAIQTKNVQLAKAVAVIAEQENLYDNNDYCLMWMAGPYHITHKYLASLNDLQFRETLEIVDQYFRERLPAIQDYWYFNQPDLFGPNQDVYVLRADPTTDMMLDLKKELDLRIKPDDYGEYKPHITCDPVFKSITIKPDSYQLRKGDEIIRSWAI